MELPKVGYVLYDKALKIYYGIVGINLYTNKEDAIKKLNTIAEQFRGDYEIQEIEIKTK